MIGVILILLTLLVGCGYNEQQVCYAQCRNVYFHNLSDSCYEAFDTEQALECGLSYNDALISKELCFDKCFPSIGDR